MRWCWWGVVFTSGGGGMIERCNKYLSRPAPAAPPSTNTIIVYYSLQIVRRWGEMNIIHITTWPITTRVVQFWRRCSCAVCMIYQGCAWCWCCLCAVLQICSEGHGYDAGDVLWAGVTPLPTCSLHYLSIWWMVPSPGGDERQTTDEDAGQLCQLWCAPGILMGSSDRWGRWSAGVGGGEWRSVNWVVISPLSPSLDTAQPPPAPPTHAHSATQARAFVTKYLRF